MTVTYTIRPANRQEAKPLIGLYSESGAGKTWSALLLARGFVGPKGRIVQIETESGRGEAYQDLLPGSYDVISMRESFAPVELGAAIDVAEKGTADALIIDSGSHEWEAVGGVLHQAAVNIKAGMKGVLAWHDPKLDHQRHFVLRLLSTPIPLVILCMRARYPMEEGKTDKGEKTWTRSTALTPYQSDAILFEMFLHGWIDRAHAYHGTKYSRDDLRAVLRDGEPITLDTGRRLAAWARGEPVGEPTPSRLAADPSRLAADAFLARWAISATPAERDAISVEVKREWERFSPADQKRLLEGKRIAERIVG